MAVTSCKLRRARSCTFDRRNRGAYQVEYDVRTNSLMGPKLVANQALTAVPHALPGLGEDYDFESILGTGEKDQYSYALDYTVEVDDSDNNHFVITVNFTPLEPGETPEQRTTADPENRGARVFWDSETVMEIADRDKDGRPIVTGNNRPFDRPPQLEEDRPLLVARFNVGTLAACVGIQQTYSKAVNSIPWTYITPNPAARTIWCKSAKSGELVTEGSYSYYPIEMIFAFAEEDDNWDLRILNEEYGHYKIAPSQTYGYAFATSDFDTSDDPITVTGGVIIENTASVSVPTSIAQPTVEVSGKAGDQISMIYTGGSWKVGEPSPKLKSNGEPVSQKAYEIDENGVEDKTKPMSSPVLLYANGCRLPEGMIGNFITSRKRREVNFNALNSYLIP
jgi:hypothetical protein